MATATESQTAIRRSRHAPQRSRGYWHRQIGHRFHCHMSMNQRTERERMGRPASSHRFQGVGSGLSGLLASSQLYKTGRKKSVSAVDEIRPPMTTVASGFGISAPTPVAK